MKRRLLIDYILRSNYEKIYKLMFYRPLIYIFNSQASVYLIYDRYLTYPSDSLDNIWKAWKSLGSSDMHEYHALSRWLLKLVGVTCLDVLVRPPFRVFIEFWRRSNSCTEK